MNTCNKINLFKILINDEVENLISYLYIKYPNIITKEIKNKLINKYNNNFEILDKLNEKNNKKKIIKFKKKILNKKFKIKYNRIVKKNACEARIWNGGIITKNNYGSRCSRNKLKNSKYCKQHSSHNKHGNYLEKTHDKIIKKFEKYNK